MISVKADFSYPNHLIPKTEAITIDTKMTGEGSILEYIRPGGIQSCQLQMGTGNLEGPKVMNGRELLPGSSSWLLYYFNGAQTSFIWAATSCE
jgi:5-keto 4-deoxyuronate isomerase